MTAESGRGSSRVGTRRRRSLADTITLALLGLLTLVLAGYTLYLLAVAETLVSQQEDAAAAAAWDRAALQLSTFAPDALNDLAAAADTTTRATAPLVPTAGDPARPQGTLVGVLHGASGGEHSTRVLSLILVHPDGTSAAVSEEGRHLLVHAVTDNAPGGQLDVVLDGVRYRIQVGPLPRAGPWLPADHSLVVGLPRAGYGAFVATGLPWALGGVLGTLAIAMLIGRWRIHHTLRPLTHVADMAEQVAAMDLERRGVDRSRVHVSRNVLHGADEVALVGEAMNRLIGAVDTALESRRMADERFRRFVAMSSHELRTPLASVRGYAEMIGMTEQLSERGRLSLDRVMGQAERMTALVDGLLTLGRFDADARERASAGHGTEAVRTASVRACEILLDGLMDARAAWPDHHWTITLLDHAVADEDGNPTFAFLGAEEALEQIAGNLLSNAGRHTPPGTTVAVTLRRVREDGGTGWKVWMQVHDDGGGIPEDILATVFEPFVRGARPSGAPPVKSSTGLGLPILARAVRSVGGTVTVTSRDGWTSFDVVMPVVELAPDGLDAPSVGPESALTCGDGLTDPPGGLPTVGAS